jgi:hypothetical protein
MSIFDRLRRSLDKRPHVILAHRIQDQLVRAWKATDASDSTELANAAAELDRSVSEFTQLNGMDALRAAVEHWAVRLASVKQAHEAATLFSSTEGLGVLVELCRKVGNVDAGRGLIHLQEGMNEAGVIMSPTELDLARKRAGRSEGDLGSDPITVMVDQLWPLTRAEADLRARIAGLARVSLDVAGWELLAVRDHAFVMTSLAALRRDETRQRELSATVYTMLADRSRAGPGNLGSWLGERRARYLGLLPEGTNDWVTLSVAWLEAVRSQFMVALGTKNRLVGLIGGAAFDRAYSRLTVCCRRFAKR